ncbi:PREDICTED: lysine-specific demethylase JMJ25 [Nelumbo nucifera]|uniref:Lysine-specific demethylase JMJ25 n=2 Tax=Nelumbo nucifera TaxID=4432 RepID=A0A822ZBS2_NELNU|nr:PREDICTED: lysine-specific demethylase JMJ25 [Nelumbo nucifera]DAD38988.1 TPA_asm: hypothetical protein HUJ06_013311 [Nelumbo nucifera]
MDHPRTGANADDNVGIPEDLRCKRSDGKQWRCSAMSMPDKTVCEKHYIQAKKRAANSALRASLKKAKRKSLGESDIYLESRNDDLDMPLVSSKGGEYHAPTISGKKYKEKVSKAQVLYSPETPPVRVLPTRSPLKSTEDPQRDLMLFDDNRKSSYKIPASSKRNFDANALADLSDRSTDTSEEAGGQTCHQCRRNDRGRVIWCLKCDRRGYCDSCIAKWYPDISYEEIQRVCPACRGSCNCKACLRGDNLIKVRIRDIAVQDKLQYLHCLLSSVLPVIKQIHSEQSSEMEIETKLHGTKTDIPRAKVQADEQMCCNCCRTPIVDYHRHCANCMYDLCLSCCRDLREASHGVVGEQQENQLSERSQDGVTMIEKQKTSKLRMVLSEQFPDWKANSNGSIPCPPKEYGGCSCSSLSLRRIFKINWVAKLVKNVEEMVNGCKVYNVDSPRSLGLNDPKFCQAAHREGSDDNFLYCPTCQDIKVEGIGHFRKHWIRGEPIIVRQVFDGTSSSSWDPMVIWRGIRETTDEKTKDDNRTVKAIDCLDWSEVDIELGQFIKGYSEGRIHENGWPEMLRLKDWPSPSASEEFLLYQRPDFISKLPLLEYIHSKWGLLNVAANLPHYSLQNDVGPKILISYGIYEELGRGDSVDNLHISMRDMVYLLMHTSEVKLKGWQRSKIEKIQRTFKESDARESSGDVQTSSHEGGKSPDLALEEHGMQNENITGLDINKDEIMEEQSFSGMETASGGERKDLSSGHPNKDNGDLNAEKSRIGAVWDVFRRPDVPNLIEYLKVYWEEIRKSSSLPNDSVTRPLYDQAVFLNKEHLRKLKEELGIEPWTFKQYVGEAVFIPAGCPFQVRNLQSSVQLGLDFLSPESLSESLRLAEEIRSLPNDHEMKLQMLEVGKMSLYAASSAIKEVQKLVLDPKSGAELGFDDPNLTAMVADNLEKMIKRRQITCV